MKARFLAAAVLLLLLPSCAGTRPAIPAPPPPDDPVLSGRIAYWTGANPHDIQARPISRDGNLLVPARGPGRDEYQIGVEWDEPRDFKGVEIEWDGPPPAEESLRLEYWHLSWPSDFTGGWTAIDDPYRGRFTKAATIVATEGTRQRIECLPLDKSEFPIAYKYPAIRHRRALKVRVAAKGAVPNVHSLRTVSIHTWKETSVMVQFGQDYLPKSGPTIGSAKSTSSVCWDGRAEVENGAVLEVRPIAGGKFEVAADNSWKGATSGRADGVLIRLLHLDGASNFSDQTKVLLRTRERSVTFNVTDLLYNWPLDVRDCGVYIAPAGRDESATAYRKRTAGLAGLGIYDRVARHPEQSYERAAKEIPQLMPEKHKPHGMYLPVGPDNSRQEIGITYNGNLFIDRTAVMRPGPEAALQRWGGSSLLYFVGTGEGCDFRRNDSSVAISLVDDVLPMPVAEWERDGLKHRQTGFGTFLHHTPDGAGLKGTEPTAAYLRLEVSNPGDEARPAVVWLHQVPAQEVKLEEGLLLSTKAGNSNLDRPAIRAAVKGPDGQFDIAAMPGGENALRWRADVPPKSSVRITLVVPFATDGNERDLAVLKEADFDGKFEEVRGYWQSLIDRGAKLITSETQLNRLSQAVFPHIAISADPDYDTGHSMLPAATFGYGVCADETGFQIRAMDRWGHHEWAEKSLQPFLDLQGSAQLNGRFKSREGVLRGLVVGGYDYESFQYSLTHGYLMMALGEHYKFTGDEEWLDRSAPKLIAACDFVTRERQATKQSPFEEDPLESGLMPACHLDDNVEWLYWYCVNAYAYRGMQWIGEALADAGHPEAKRIQKDAADFRADLRRSLIRAMERSPVVRLRDGTAIPHVPVRARLRGRDLGWIREPLYGPFMYAYCGIFDVDEQITTWVAKDHEDNLFIDPRWGRKLPSPDTWFSHGGITVQCNLLPNPVVYLDRDQVEHAIRGVFNGLAASLYPGRVYCFAEHPVEAYGYGVGPFYKIPDEAGMLHWYRELLVHEEGDRLILAKGTPRAWLEEGRKIVVERAASYFGPLTYRVESKADGIAAVIEPPQRKKPVELLLRLRHPRKARIESVTLNGKPWTKFDADKEWIELPAGEKRIELVARY